MRFLQHLAAHVASASLGIVISAPARAAEPTSPSADPAGQKSATAQVLFDEAIREMSLGKAADACPKFKRSFELDPKSSALGNLGLCYETIGKLGSAWATYQELSAYARNKGRFEWAERAEARIAELTPKLIHLVLHVSNPPKDFQLLKDGAPTSREEWQIPVVVDPGVHKLDGSAPGFTPWHGEVDCSEAGKTCTITVPRLAKAPEPPKPIVPTPPLRIVGYIGLGLGGAGLITGGVLGLMAKNSYDASKLDGGCTDVDQTTSSCTNLTGDVISKRTTAGTLATGSTIAFIGGAFLVAAGITLVVVSKDKTSATKFSVVPNPSLAGGGIMATGTF